MNVVPDLAVWDTLSFAECEQIARALILPVPFRFDGVERYAVGGQERYVAFFDHNNDRFALIPGSENAVLGYDPDNPFVPSPEQAESWEYTMEEWEARPLLTELPNYLTPIRSVTIAPFLLETEPKVMGYTPIRNSGYSIRSITWQEADATCRSQGLRLSTSDEWEYACAAGTRTLFYWGDDTPCSESFSELDHAVKRPNAFGLRIAYDSYKWEWTSDPFILRGGDGGGSVCGGTGAFSVWLTHASAYSQDTPFYSADPAIDDGITYSHLRRAMSVRE